MYVLPFGDGTRQTVPMCGRFAMDDQVNELLESFVEEHGAKALRDWRASFNIAPTQQVPVLREHSGQREVLSVRWGMVSPGSPTFGGGKPVFNARIETVSTNGLFKRPFAESRCIVFASGYYEWQLRDDGKQPFYIHQPGEQIAMAGVTRAWRDPERSDDDPDRWRHSMTIITLLRVTSTTGCPRASLRTATPSGWVAIFLSRIFFGLWMTSRFASLTSSSTTRSAAR
jgi:putative SOS response-associated peptidase YedK